MPARNHNDDTLLDKFLGVFGIRRPKKTSRTASGSAGASRAAAQRKSRSVSRSAPHPAKRRTSSVREEEAPLIGDNFELIEPAHKQNGKKKEHRGWRNVGRVLVACFLIGIISVCLIVGSFMIYVFAFVDGTVEQDLNNLKLAYTSILYADDPDKEGKYVELARLHGEENRLWVDLDTMPDYVKYAFISAEDKRFYKHDGVDWKRTFSSFVNLFFHIYDTQQGGSTITQQLVKNLTNDKETSAMRKVREIMRARYLEGHYDKDVIVECYLNTIHLGNGADGVEVAACYYFDKHASDLTLTQAACLAALTKSPTGYDPYEYPEDNKTRRDWVLNEMENNGYISAEECEAAKNADLGLRKTPSTVLSSTNSVKEEYNSWFVDTVIEDVIKGLMNEKGYDYDYAEKMLYQGGYKIYTTVDLNAQKILEDVFKDDDNFSKVISKSNKSAQASMTIMDYEGHVVAIVGGRGEKTGNRVLNRAIQSPRQTGSSIKPVTCYAPALEYNVITYASKVTDRPVDKLANGMKPPTSSWPSNYSGYYSGKVSVLWALEQSLNTVPVRLVQSMGIETVYKFATEKMGLTTLVREATLEDGSTGSDLGESSLALGGSVYGTTSRLLTAAYVPFGNLGKYYQPTTFTKVLDQKDEIVLQEAEPKTAIAEDTANVMCEMLQRVTQYGTGSPAAFGSWPIMSKTGTTSDTRDRWFVGGTPYYVAAVWFGLDNNEKMTIYGTNPALRLWKAAMQPIHKNLKLKDFPQSDMCEYRRYCTVSGMVANSGCTSTAYGWFKGSYQPVCDVHYGDKLKPATKPKPVGEEEEKPTYSQEKTTARVTTTQNPKTTAVTTTPTTTPTTAAPPPETTVPPETEPPVSDTTQVPDETIPVDNPSKPATGESGE